MRPERSQPVDAASVMRMATAYLARYSSSTAGLRLVLGRKIRRRCDRTGTEPPNADEMAALLDEVIGRLTRAGLMDDAAFARARVRRLTEKGLPRNRIRRDLQVQGLSLDDADEMLVADEEAQARRFAVRKRLGPFRTGPRTLYRDKDVRALVRAGFAPRLAMRIVDGTAENQSWDDLGADP